MAFVEPSILQAKSLSEFIISLRETSIEHLYIHPANCLAIFRDLPQLSRIYILRILFVDQIIPESSINTWSKCSKEHEIACNSLQILKIVTRKTVSGRLGGWALNDLFKKNLKIALNGGGQSWDVQAMTEKDERVNNVTDFMTALETYPLERWEQILHFMVGLKDESFKGVSADIQKTLVHSKLIIIDSEDNLSMNITSDGFQFLLMDTKSQTWLFVLKLLELKDKEGSDLVECLTLLLQLNFSTHGRDYSTANLSKTNTDFIQNLREIGLVYQRSRKDGRFYPTRLVIDLAGGLKDVTTDIHRLGFIIVESNYRLYAYTNNRLQIALIALFCDIHYRFPNIVIGLITRSSIRQALKAGISAQQIINYLLMHVHPEVRDKEHQVPPTVIDQINLWERERDKFLFTEGVLYSQFNSQQDFDLLRQFAYDKGVLVFDNPTKRVMVVNNNGHDEVRRFWKKQKKVK